MKKTPRAGLVAGLLVSSVSLFVLVACASKQMAEVEPDVSAEQMAKAEAQRQKDANTVVMVDPNVQQQPPAVTVQQPAMAEAIVATGQRREGYSVDVSRGTWDAKSTHALAAPAPAYMAPQPSRDQHVAKDENAVKAVMADPVSTFSVDVDTASYSFVRNRLNEGELPNPAAVRVEEMINYFPYQYAAPTGEVPFSVTTDAMVTPWNKETYLLRVGLQGQRVTDERPAANLVFLVDVSGSMASPDKLPLLVKSLQYMAGQLKADDKVTIVVYAGASGLALDVTSGADVGRIRAALSNLRSGGSTAGEAGIRLAYMKAREAFIKDGINRVILATDGDFNVGISDRDDLKKLIEQERKSGVALTTLGFGNGNFNDALMEQLADAGNGNYAYIDSFTEARKVLGDQISGTLMTIAKDVKIQVEFNPALVAEYRLIGYENRMLNREDFDNDTVDAGEIGAGHNVTALYEIALVGSKGRRLGDLRYQTDKKAEGRKDELAFVKIRYKAPDGDVSKLIDEAVPASALYVRRAPSPDLVHASAVAAFGQLLGGSRYMEGYGFKDVKALAERARTDGREWSEFLGLVDSAASLDGLNTAPGR
ncbi:MAG: VWA domain-containing protein [Alphaproteobacteria bacterium]|nr:MAG: VWA domain-containing protein [Alphaproteobacteria bacterium]